MKDAGHIDGRLAEWATTLRGVRNAGAHYDVKTPITAQDAEDSVAFSEALLDYLYVLTARFEALKARRASPENPALPPKRDPSDNSTQGDEEAPGS